MRKKPTDKLIKLYQDTIDNLLLNFEKKLREGKVLDYEVYLIKSLLKAFKEAKEIRGEIRHSLQEEYIKRKIEEWEKAKPLLSPKQTQFEFEEFSKVDAEEIETIYSMFNNKIGRAEKGIGRQVRGWFEKEQKAITNATNRATRDQLTSRFMGKSKNDAISDLVVSLKENIYFKLIDKNGNPLKMKIDSYAKLSINSMFQQARNTATINSVKELESDLVIFSKHYWTCETCAKYAEG
ncbi:MAG: phage minor capsid protein, partial [Cetobacterium sp.]